MNAQNGELVFSLYPCTGLGTPRDPTFRAGQCGQGKGSQGLPAETAASLTRPQISGCLWMDGWIDLGLTLTFTILNSDQTECCEQSHNLIIKPFPVAHTVDKRNQYDDICFSVMLIQKKN